LKPRGAGGKRGGREKWAMLKGTQKLGNKFDKTERGLESA